MKTTYGTDLVEYLKDFLIQNSWCEKYTKEQARAIFTTICLTQDIDADTAECDNILSYVYDASYIVEVIDFDEYATFSAFQSYMVGLIV